MSLIIAGTSSGVGKTTVTLTLLASLCRQGLQVQSFKVGPDYIDPMFHKYVTGRHCRNLDPVLTSEIYVQQCFEHHLQEVDYALIEGVMGLFDGVNSNRAEKQFPHVFASTAHIARLLKLPILLVIDCSRLSGSVAAIAHGYSTLDPSINIAGVVLNRVGSDRHLSLLENALEPMNLAILGVLRRQNNIQIPDRHLGLIPTDELPQLNTVIEQLADLGDSCFDWEKLLPLLKPEIKASHSITSEEDKGQGAGSRGENPMYKYSGLKPFWQRNPKSFLYSPSSSVNRQPSTIRIAIACDRAFNFYYQDNLDLLQQLGAELVYWSPLEDSELPANIQGMYFGGGFPEVFAPELTANASVRAAVKTKILTGIPTIAECGGLMYLCQDIIDFEGKSWSMVGVLSNTSRMEKNLTLGYRRAVALKDSPIVSVGTTIYGHEFHRSSLVSTTDEPLLQTYRYDSEEIMGWEGWNNNLRLHASYIHLHWGGNPEIPQRFLNYCCGIVC
ncbi:cobyrinate a,c-diamide synthase [Calothrix rhizosoleniae]|uniref:cobyrinate a,c-diamide synthase n=1 Tax=Calothrix rhizosoleniae TaxID=888997 RepID=UPI000B49A0C9|nr:cobyrinate a,c-diamide synthase [Calothrix rhizosoleniae]